MKINRKIERVIKVTPEEIYYALAALHDLPKGDVAVAIDDVFTQEVTITVTEYGEQEL